MKPEPELYLIYDHREPGHPDGPKLTRARHNDLDAAIGQAELDLSYGRGVVRIEDAEGNVVWEP